MDKASPTLEGYDDWMERLLANLPVERRLAGLDPEQRLAGLDPEQIARAVPAEHRVLALPDDALRALSEEYVATLPDDVQAKVRARRGR